MSQYVLEYLTDAGINDICMILGDISPEKVRDYYGDGSKFNCNIQYIDQGAPFFNVFSPIQYEHIGSKYIINGARIFPPSIYYVISNIPVIL